MSETIPNLTGWIPAFILPRSTLIQLIKIAKLKMAEGVNLLTWLLFGLANLGLYVYAEKYLALQSIIGLLGTAIMDFVIVSMILSFRRRREAGETYVR